MSRGNYLKGYFKEMQGRGGGREGAGGASSCICPSCGYTIAHARGTPCNAQTCPKCGTRLTGKGAPGEIKGTESKEEE